MKKKILKLVLGSSVGMVAMGLIIIIPCLMLMDFFGANVTDGFVENNSEYADTYKSVLNQNIKTKTLTFNILGESFYNKKIL